MLNLMKKEGTEKKDVGAASITSSCTLKISFLETFRVLHMAGKRITGRRFTVWLFAHVCAHVIKSVVNRLCRI